MCIKYIAYWGGRNHIVFIGDERIRQLYIQFVRSIRLDLNNLSNIDYKEDLEYIEKDLNLDIKFLWRPMVNKSMIDEVKSWTKLKDYLKPHIVIMGSAVHSIKFSNGSSMALEFYRKNLTILLPYMESLNRTTKILWVLQDPIKTELLKKEKRMITNELIDSYNKAAMEALRYTNVNTVHVWSSARLVAQGFTDIITDTNTNDGLQIDSNSLKFSIQILLNLYCNDHMNYNDGTCCSDPEKATAIQLIVLIVFTIFIIMSATIYIYARYFGKRNNFQIHRYKWTRLKNDDEFELIQMQDEVKLFDRFNNDNNNNNEEMDENECLTEEDKIKFETEPKSEKIMTKMDLIHLLSRLGLIMLYFYLCDRTNFFMKENKYFTRPNFLLPIAYVFALGLFFTDESSQIIALHTDQTNEMKGWMQLIILGLFN